MFKKIGNLWRTHRSSTKIILDESKYGVGLNSAWRWAFYNIKSNNEDKFTKSHITVTNNKKPILIAVTKDQYKSWNGQKIIAEKRSIVSFWIDVIKRIFK